ncbi:MAG TPA: glutamate-cysteine ligase family protein [Polyangiaceae bacterium]|nr:glutamate-cysteine ligase family protein [Polyangiaceae bacterium]
MSTSEYPWPAFAGYGIEAEYMIVDRQTLDVRPIADLLLHDVGGGYELEVERGLAAWSNELALHVIEMKTAGISRDLAATAQLFQLQVADMNERLAKFGARLLPTGMHPWMDPERELRLWPHENDVIYGTFDRIFDCRGHGWANLQSVHINLPFQNDEEFGRLHAAIRVVLPLLPALAASSPFCEGQRTPELDRRVEVYRHNAARVPSVSGRVIPERVFDRKSYEDELLAGIYRDLAPHDPDGVLAEEWVNARGAIARFERGAIEIRLLDIQERPAADLSIVRLVTALVRALAEGQLGSQADQRALTEANLEPHLIRCVRDGSRAELDDPDYLRVLGLSGARSARELWGALAERLLTADDPAWPWIRDYLEHGTLAERIVAAAGPSPSRERLHETYARLADCLADGRAF